MVFLTMCDVAAAEALPEGQKYLSLRQERMSDCLARCAPSLSSLLFTLIDDAYAYAYGT
jgi:hypothetical protein